mmetsp:Transcript_73400/g.160753  ORF Transcript_73400/g.160753 Transcript_73400/m.160753 type:complete len:318 (-) Transcript_73400:222-1175(-)
MSSSGTGCSLDRLREWLFWHIGQGVSPIYLRWEGSMTVSQKALLGLFGKHIVLTKIKTTGSGAFEAVMGRQVKFTQSCIAKARKAGCSFLLHLDDDELLFPLNSSTNIQQIFEPYEGESWACLHFENLEAIFPFVKKTCQPLTRKETKFRSSRQVLYVNGKSAANLKSGCTVFCSGVHHFCRFDRTYEHPDPEYGLHDKCEGCSDPECCHAEAGAVVLHFDSPSFDEWKAKFKIRCGSDLASGDDAEMDAFPFKKESVQAMQAIPLGETRCRKVYRKWRCLPGRKGLEDLHDSIDGHAVWERFLLLLNWAHTEGGHD